jgi:Uma2 family endonuclease
MTTQTLSPIEAPAPVQAAAPSVTITPPDAGWVPVAFPPGAFDRWLRRRQRRKADRPDEVWNGVYVVMPDPNIIHQELGTRFAAGVMIHLEGVIEARVIAGINVSADREDWTKNYRCPDVAVFLPGNPAEDRKSHWLGGPDFAVEIVSKGDRSRDKFGFYASVGVRELLYVERRPWALELYRREGTGWVLSGLSVPETSAILKSSVLPLSFRLIPAEPRPRLEILGRDGRGPWLA